MPSWRPALRADPKEVAEHLMLVDLGRNDVGRVAEYGTVRVVEQMVVERYSHVMHLVSEVRGQLRAGLDALDALAAAFPAGTVSGAPKVRAMEIIDELEPTRRGPYAGAVGYVGFGARTLDTAIAIRTVVFHDDSAQVQAGAGLVTDSVPEHGVPGDRGEGGGDAGGAREGRNCCEAKSERRDSSRQASSRCVSATLPAHPESVRISGFLQQLQHQPQRQSHHPEEVPVNPRRPARHPGPGYHRTPALSSGSPVAT